MLSFSDVNNLLFQLMDMNNPNVGGDGNQLQCAYFQMAFSVAQYRLLWEALKAYNVEFDSVFALNYLGPYQLLPPHKILTSWKDIFVMLLDAEAIPFTEKEDDQLSNDMFWYGQRTLVLQLLQTLFTVARKYIITEKFASKSTSAAVSL